MEAIFQRIPNKSQTRLLFNNIFGRLKADIYKIEGYLEEEPTQRKQSRNTTGTQGEGGHIYTNCTGLYILFENNFVVVAEGMKRGYYTG